MNLSDEETIQAIRENPYMQYMLGLSEFTGKSVFDSSLFVTIRKRIGKDDFNDMSEFLLKLQVRMSEEQNEKISEENDRKDNTPSGTSAKEASAFTNSIEEGQPFHKGTLKVDATCADGEMRYPTDIDLLHDGVEVVDRFIDRICEKNGLPRPNAHLKEIHSRYLNVIKLRCNPRNKVHECMEYLLTKLYRNINTCLNMLGYNSTAIFDSMKRRDRELFITVLKMYHQQKEMFKEGVHACSDRIVSIFQPHIHPIIRAKQKSSSEPRSE